MKDIFIETIYTNYNKETGVSEAILNTDLGLIKGIAKLNPEDEEIKSVYAGCRYAETRATIKYMRRKKKEAQKNKNLFLNLLKELENTKTYNEKYVFVKIIKRKINYFNDLSLKYQEYENSLKNRLEAMIKERPEYIKKMENKKNK